MRVVKHRVTDRKSARARKRHEADAVRSSMRVTKGDTVRVMRGNERGKEGKVIRVIRKTERVVIEGVNMVKRHRKARRPDDQSGIIDMPAPIHVSNVMLLDAKKGVPTRLRTRIDEDGTKERLGAKSGEPIPRAR